MRKRTNHLYLLRSLGLCLALFLLNIPLWAQITVTGIASDKDTGEPLPGVNILVKGTLIGSVSNLEGQYSIQVADAQAIIQFSYIGYLTQEVEVGNQTVIDVALVADNIDLEEVVVIGYGAIKKSDVTGAISSIDTEEISKMITSSAAQALQGRASGVQVTQNSGSPGSGFDIKIRGTGTINNSSPLFVVDGVIVEDISHIPPENIESFEALKDAGSAAIYGSRAANGVILITTKSGSEGPIQVDLNASYAWQDYWKVIEVMDPNEYMFFQQMARREASVINHGYDVFMQDLPPEEMWRELFDNDPIEGQFVGDWLDLISQNGAIQKYNLSLRGGSERISYYVSGNLLDQKGMIDKSTFNDKSILSDLNFDITDKLSLRTNINFSSQRQGVVPDNTFKEALIFSPTSSIYEPSGDGYLIESPYTNVLWYHENQRKNLLTISLQLKYDISKALSFQSRAAYVNTNRTTSRFWEAGDFYYFSLNNSTTDIRRMASYTDKLQWENMLSYIRDINRHSINAVGVISLESSSYEYMYGKIRGGVGNSLNTAYLSSGFQNLDVAGSAKQWADLGFVTRINYDFDDRYLIQVNFRADGSSRFIEQRWGYFPSASLGWRLSQENFLNLPAWINMLKLRGSWGQLGNNRIDEYGAYTFLSSGMEYVFGSEQRNSLVDGWAPLGVAYDAIEWEKTTTYNVATDIGLFNALVFNLEYFWKYTTDMLIQVPVVPSTGMDSSPFRNAGEVENKGIELTMNYRDNIGKLNWDMNLNFSYIQNEIISLGKRSDPVYGPDEGFHNSVFGADDPYFRTKTQVGHPIGEFYGWVVDDINRANGEFDFVDINGDGIINEYDRTAIGNPQPRYFTGFNLSMNYGGFDFSLFLQGVFKVDVWNILLYDLKSFNNTNAFNDSWQEFYLSSNILGDELYTELDNTETATLPTAYTLDAGKSYRPSDFYVEDASYLRIKNVQLGYTLPRQLTEKVGVDRLRVYVGGMNLLTFTNYSGLDPEVGGGSNTAKGFDNANYPQARSIAVGINATF